MKDKYFRYITDDLYEFESLNEALEYVNSEDGIDATVIVKELLCDIDDNLCEDVENMTSKMPSEVIWTREKGIKRIVKKNLDALINEEKKVEDKRVNSPMKDEVKSFVFTCDLDLIMSYSQDRIDRELEKIVEMFVDGFIGEHQLLLQPNELSGLKNQVRRLVYQVVKELGYNVRLKETREEIKESFSRKVIKRKSTRDNTKVYNGDPEVSSQMFNHMMGNDTPCSESKETSLKGRVLKKKRNNRS